MKQDFVATYSLIQQPDHIQRQAVDYLLGAARVPPGLAHLAEVTDPVARVELLAQALVTTSKSYAQSGDRRTGTGGLKQALGTLDRCFQARLRDFVTPLGLLPTLPPLEILPDLSFALHFTFVLRKPYLSQDEAEFYIIDNPVRKDKVFRLPYVAPSQWKGALRAAMVRQLAEWWQGLKQEEKSARTNRKQFVAWRVQLTRLFGTEKSVQPDDRSFEVYLDELGGDRLARWYRRYVRRFLSPAGFCAGRLHFYPTFFTQIGLEIINPHSRETGAGEVPILIESVPAGAEGTFTLLYVPLGEPEARREVLAKLERVTEGLQAMFTEYGFGAKTSSGFGAAEDRLATEGKLVLRAELRGMPAKAPAEPEPEPAPDLPRYLESPARLHPDFRRPDGSLKTEEEYQALIEGRGQKYAKKDRLLYGKAKAWWEREGRARAEAPTEEPEPVVEPAPSPAPPVAEWTFTTLSELPEVARQVATLLQEGGAA